MMEELEQKYDELRTVIETLPVNTKYNRKRKVECIDDEIKHDKEIISLIEKEVEERLAPLRGLGVNTNIKKMEEEIEKCNIINEWNPYNTPYEKMHLDYYLYQLHRYYKEDLDALNECIKRIIESFKKVEIELKPEEFNYNVDAKEYMSFLLTEHTKEEIKECFESIYWKNSDLIKIIELNFKSIYLKYEKKIVKYYVARHEEFLKSHTDEEIHEMRLKLSNELRNLEGTDPYQNLSKFVDYTYLLKDFSEVEFDRRKSLYFSDENYNLDNLLKIDSSLEEYDILIKYNYLLKDMRARLEKKEEYKNALANALKDISKDEDKITKMVSKQSAKPKLFFKKKKVDDKWLFDYNQVLNDLSTKYDALDDLRLNDLIMNTLNKDSTVYEVLKLVVSNYLYFVARTKELEDGADINEINKRYDELKYMVYNRNNYMLLSNLALLDERQIKQIISDKYTLENINISMEALTEDNIEKTIKDINMLIDYEYFKLSGLKIEDIDLYIEYSKVKEKEEASEAQS